MSENKIMVSKSVQLFVMILFACVTVVAGKEGVGWGITIIGPLLHYSLCLSFVNF